MNINGVFPDYISCKSEHGVMINQHVEYEWKPKKCDNCGLLGYEAKKCRKKVGRTVWRPKGNSIQPEQQPIIGQQHMHGEDKEAEGNRQIEVDKEEESEDNHIHSTEDPVVEFQVVKSRSKPI